MGHDGKRGWDIPPSPLNHSEPAPSAGSNTGSGTARTDNGQRIGFALPMDQSIHEAMSNMLKQARYTPARLLDGKEAMIIYYAWDPDSGQLKRQREHLNREKKQLAPSVFKRLADDRIRKINAMLAMGWSPFRDGTVRYASRTLAQACEAFLAAKTREKRRKDTLRSYTSLVGLLLRWVQKGPLPQITAAAFDESMAKQYLNDAAVERELSAKTFNNNHTFYVTLWNWFKEQDYVQRNVFQSVKKKPLDPEGGTKRPPTAQERAMIRADLEKSNPRFFAFCLLCFHCAIRPKEAFMLKPEHFDLQGRRILIPGYVAKNKRTQGVAIPEVLVPVLEDLQLQAQRPEHYVFSKDFQPGGRLEDSRHSGRAWQRLRDRTGLSKSVSMYQLKHAGGEQLSRDGVSAADLMNHMRHQDLAETSIYTKRAYRDGVRTVIDKATPF